MLCQSFSEIKNVKVGFSFKEIYLVIIFDILKDFVFFMCDQPRIVIDLNRNS